MQILALGGGGLYGTRPETIVNAYVLGLTDVSRPKICFIPTASGDAAPYIVNFYNSFSPARCLPSHLGLFNHPGVDLRALLLSQDVICVGGGNTANMLAIWRVHGVDAILREAWEAGIILC